MIPFRLLVIGALGACAGCAQDPFEIHVYEYEPLQTGEFTYEAHLNYVLKGATVFSGTLAPMRHQLHFTSEVTAGVQERFAIGLMLLTALRPGQTLEYAGWRVLPHFYAPPSWHLPVKVGLVAEFSFQNSTFEENVRRVEIRPIVDKHIGNWELVGNPAFERALRGPGTSAGWAFEPAGRIGWRASKDITPSIEYYSSLGSLRDLPAVPRQFHQVLPGADLRIGDRLTWSFGAGVGLTGTGNRLVLKSRFEFSFGGKGQP